MIGTFALLGDVEGDKVSPFESLETSIRLLASFAMSIPSLHTSEDSSQQTWTTEDELTEILGRRLLRKLIPGIFLEEETEEYE